MAGAILPDRALAAMQDKTWIALKTTEGQLKETQKLNADLRRQLAEIDESFRAVMAEECAPDEKHCTCVPLLRREITCLRACSSALTKENGDLKRRQDTAMVDTLLAKNDELAMMAARCTALADQFEQAQTQLAATSRALNEMMAERDALKRKAAEWFGKTADAAEAKP